MAGSFVVYLSPRRVRNIALGYVLCSADALQGTGLVRHKSYVSTNKQLGIEIPFESRRDVISHKPIALSILHESQDIRKPLPMKKL